MVHRYYSLAKNGAHLNSIFVNNLLTVKARDTIQIVLESTWNEKNDFSKIDSKFVDAWKSHWALKMGF